MKKAALQSSIERRGRSRRAEAKKQMNKSGPISEKNFKLYSGNYKNQVPTAIPIVHHAQINNSGQKNSSNKHI
jgi:hypothetical protein